MEQRAVVVPGSDVGQEVVDGCRCQHRVGSERDDEFALHARAAVDGELHLRRQVDVEGVGGECRTVARAFHGDYRRTRGGAAAAVVRLGGTARL